jgi:hypothetical protein
MSTKTAAAATSSSETEANAKKAETSETQLKVAQAHLSETGRQLEMARATVRDLEQRLKGGDREITRKQLSEAKTDVEYLELRLEGAKALVDEASEKDVEERADRLWDEMQSTLGEGLAELDRAMEAYRDAGRHLVEACQTFHAKAAGFRPRWVALLPEGASDNDPLPPHLGRFRRLGLFGALGDSVESPTAWEWPAIPLALTGELMKGLQLEPKWEDAVRPLTDKGPISHQLEKLRRVLAEIRSRSGKAAVQEPSARAS